MILAAAGLLVLAGLGLFVAGLVTGTTGYYWSCVACCGLAAVLLVAARMRAGGRPDVDDGPPPRTPAPEGSGTAATGAGSTAADTAGTGAAGGVAGAETTGTEAAGDVAGASTGRHAVPDEPADVPQAQAPPAPPVASADEPAEEDVEMTDLLLVVDSRDQVLVVDERPRYHLADCAWLRGRPTIPLPAAEARAIGFSPCGLCTPDRRLADLARSRR